MHWGNLVAAGAVGALAWYFVSHRTQLAEDEAEVFRTPRWATRLRRGSYLFGGLFLAFVAVVLLVGAF